jgi:lauroyl/myristoyl acyltransferase
MSGASRLLYFIGYVAFRLGEGLIRLLPLGYAFRLGAAGGELAYRILWRRRVLALRNLRLAFGQKSADAELRELNRRHFQLVGANLLAGLKAATLPHEKIWQRVTAAIPEKRDQSGWIALISHTGNWELYSHLGQRFPEYRFGTVYQPVANPFIDRYLRAARTRSGIRLFDRRTQLLSCVRFLREGGVVGVLADQGAGYAGLWTPLFGRLTSSSTLAARLSLRTRLPIVPIAITTSGPAQWEMKISDPMYPTDDDADRLTAQINRVLEEQIRRSPVDWLWAHNRWKPLRPHFLFARDQRQVFFPPGFDRAALDPFRILIVAPDSPDMPDSILPAIRAIREGRPDTWLAALVSNGLANRWTDDAVIDMVLQVSAQESICSLAARIRKAAPFDVAIFFAASWKASLAACLAGIPLRVGMRGGMNSWLCNQHPTEPAQPLGPLEMNLHIARSVGANTNAAPT